CHLPPYAGPCNGKFQRYFYNKTSKQCEIFTYGGCNQNKNSFHYQYDCENKCGECPPTCTAQFCLLHRFNVCSMSPFPEPNNNCPGGCRLSSCQAYYYSPTIEPHPKGGDSCTKCDGQELDVTCMKNWGTCLRIAYIQSPEYEY
ncbi:PREDICTED: chelonianin-like, partial [Amphimedon queenslandica]|uniref:BPTI/Kunitz inhibitor domain-containing protein n=1 Tax=Amphimedon queenslandica TaxID=400682 RepID=A0A1X7T1E1_AMPQE